VIFSKYTRKGGENRMKGIRAEELLIKDWRE